MALFKVRGPPGGKAPGPAYNRAPILNKLPKGAKMGLPPETMLSSSLGLSGREFLSLAFPGWHHSQQGFSYLELGVSW